MEAKENGNRPAMARPASVNPTHGSLIDGDSVIHEQTGLTKQELFAAMMMQGELASQSPDNEWATPGARKLAERCVAFADALLAELAKNA